MINSALLVARCVLGYIFLLAGSRKLLSSNTLEDAIRQYQILPKRLVRITARLLPYAECLLGSLAFLGIALPLVTGILALMLVAFTLAVGINVRRGESFSCHCFGSSAATIGPAMIIRNLFLIIIALFATSQSVYLLSIQATLLQWQFDFQQIARLDSLLPTFACIFLLLASIFLISEVDPILNHHSGTAK